MARPSLYEPKYHVPWAWSLAIEGLDIKTIADRMQISKKTLERWRNEYPEMKDALDTGREAADAQVKKALYDRAIGFTVEETKTTIEYDKDGKPRPSRAEKIKKHIVGDVGAQAMWLKNRAGWRDNPVDNTETVDDLGEVLKEAMAREEGKAQRKTDG